MSYGCYRVMVYMELWLLCRMAGAVTRKQTLSVCAMAKLSLCAIAQHAWPLYFFITMQDISPLLKHLLQRILHNIICKCTA